MSRRRIARPTFAILLALIWTLVCTYAIAFIGLAAPKLGFLWAGLIYALGLVAASFLWGGRSRTGPLIVAGALSLGLGLTAWYALPPSHERIVDVADKVEIPSGWQQLSEDQRGNGWCLQGCPAVERDYELPVGTVYAGARDTLVAELDDEGWDRVAALGNETDALERGRWRVAILETRAGRVSLSFSG